MAMLMIPGGKVGSLIAQARLDGLRTALAALAFLALIALFFSAPIPTRPPGSARTRPSEPHPDAAGAQTPDRPEQATTVTGTI
jgi:hypothetical protein